MPRTLLPPISTTPESGVSNPARMFINVVLPDPVNPTIDTNSPCWTERFTPLSTSRVLPLEPKDFEMSRTSTNATSVAPLEFQFYVGHHSIQKETDYADRENAKQNLRVD